MKTEIITEIFNDLSESSKLAVIQVGLETLWEANGIAKLGHTSIAGHCCYIKKESPLLIHKLLLTLNGNKSADYSDDLAVGVFRPIIDRMTSVFFKGVSV